MPIVQQQPQRFPLTRQHEVGVSIAIHVGQYRGRHHADVTQHERVQRVELEAAVHVSKQSGRCGERILLRHRTRPNEEIDTTIVVHVAEGQRSGRRRVRTDRR